MQAARTSTKHLFPSQRIATHQVIRLFAPLPAASQHKKQTRLFCSVFDLHYFG
jgi:hypothetical protein